MSRRRFLQQTIGLAIVVVLMVGCSSAEPTATSTPIPPTSTPVPPTPTPMGSGKVDVGAYSLYITCGGEESPTVVLDSGIGFSGSGSWFTIMTHLLKNTTIRVCAYDRLGVGKSDFAPEQPRTSQDMVDDLQSLLINANIEGPYVLVAASMAGFNALLYASQSPQDVVGVVLVESIHPDTIAGWLRFLESESPDENRAVERFRGILGWVLDDPTDVSENWDWKTSAAQVRAAGSLGSIPLVVLTRERQKWERYYGSDFPPELAESFEQEWQQQQKELAELSSSSTHIIVENSDHMLVLNESDAVIDAILQVVDAVRDD